MSIYSPVSALRGALGKPSRLLVCAVMLLAMLGGVTSMAQDGPVPATEMVPGGEIVEPLAGPPETPIVPGAGADAGPEGGDAQNDAAPATSTMDAGVASEATSGGGTVANEGSAGIESEDAASEAPLGGDGAIATIPHDLSPWGMFMAADYVVKAVMIGLAFASLVTWSIWLAKVLELAVASRRARKAVGRIEAAPSLDEAARGLGKGWTKRGPVARLVHVASHELARSQNLPPEGVKERTAIALSRVEARAGRSMARGTGLLATIGSTAPFVGLFGTVWGIMNAFIGISQSGTTNLAVVAPGIAEALLATAIGLVAAIPAVIIYNVFSRSIAGYRALLSDASAEVLQHVSRDLDRGRKAVPTPLGRAAE